jgi:hypothetical protein
MYKCKHFIIEELVSPAAFNARGAKAWQLLDERMLITLDRLREKYGKMTVNNWKWGGIREWSGLRTPESPDYSTYSQHSFGRAADIIFNDVTAEQVRQDLLANPTDHVFEFVNSIEEGTSWLHFDVRNCDRILAFPIPFKK